MIFRAVLVKAGYGVACIAAASVLVVSNYARSTVNAVDDIGHGVAIGDSPSVGAMNILLMGLESRTDYEGNILPADLLAAMHAGSVEGVQDGVGGQDANTLILIHIFAGGTKAVGFSIPRDDWVTFPSTYDGQTEGKIDQAYGLAYAQSLGTTVNSSMSKQQRYSEANQAGQQAEIDTVESVTGQQVDHFAEVNLEGFYELAKAFGGIEVCLKSWNGGENLDDANSGFHVTHAGYQHLSAAMALAFVRERDNLPNGDLDRTHRQQAVIDYVIWKLKHQGILDSLDQLTSLLQSASSYVITDSGWNILDFASEMKALSGNNLTFETLPIEGYETIDGQDANEIDIPAIQAEVKSAFTPPVASSAPSPTTSSAKPAPSASSTSVSYPLSDTVVDVYNAGYTAGLASEVESGLVNAGFSQGEVGDLATQSSTEVLYGSGAAAQANAAKIAGVFDVTAQAGGSVTAGYVEVILGTSATLPSFSSLTGSSSASPSTSASASSSSNSASSNSAADNGASGGTVSVSDNAPYGIPCVY
ncbi:MAG: LCP family protein [Streptosporangiaceae bacterium]|jgi:LCP family protein required for cell wall assembly